MPMTPTQQVCHALTQKGTDVWLSRILGDPSVLIMVVFVTVFPIPAFAAAGGSLCERGPHSIE